MSRRRSGRQQLQKLSAVRSAVSSARAGPCTVNRTWPAATWAPSATFQSMRTRGSTWAKVALT